MENCVHSMQKFYIGNLNLNERGHINYGRSEIKDEVAKKGQNQKLKKRTS